MNNMLFFVTWIILSSGVILAQDSEKESSWYKRYIDGEVSGYRHDQWEEINYKGDLSHKQVMSIYVLEENSKEYFLVYQQDFLWDKNMLPLATKAVSYNGAIVETTQATMEEDQVVLKRDICGIRSEYRVRKTPNLQFTVAGRVLKKMGLLKEGAEWVMDTLDLGNGKIASFQWKVKEKKGISLDSGRYKVLAVEKISQNFDYYPPSTIHYDLQGKPILVEGESRLEITSLPPSPSNLIDIPLSPSPNAITSSFISRSRPHYSISLPEGKWQENKLSLPNIDISYKNSEIGMVAVCVLEGNQLVYGLTEEAISFLKTTKKAKLIAKRSMELGIDKGMECLLYSKKGEKVFYYYVLCLATETKSYQVFILGDSKKHYSPHWPTWYSIAHSLYPKR